MSFIVLKVACVQNLILPGDIMENYSVFQCTMLLWAIEIQTDNAWADRDSTQLGNICCS